MNTHLLAVGVLTLLCSVLAAAPPTLQWVDLPPLPDPFGFGGPFVGVHNGALIVAGGANFPDGPPWGQNPGQKVWYDDIYVLSAPDGSWQKADQLPKRLAYGTCLSTTDGLLLIGGEENGTAVDDVWRLRWDTVRRKVNLTPLPPLPKKSSYLTGGLAGSQVLVAASHRSAGADRLDSKSFWTIDLAHLGAQTQWKELPPWPGSARHKAVGVVQNGPEGEPNFFLISGSNPRFDEQGTADLSRFEFFTDAYRFEPRESKWQRIAGLPAVADGRNPPDGNNWDHEPRAVAAACGIGIGKSQLLVFSGATGRYLTLPIQDRPLFPRDVLAYHIPSDAWSVVSTMPQGVVTTGVAAWNDYLVVPTGEIRPGVRTSKVQAAVVKW